MIGGFKRAELDKRDYSFHRSFGTTPAPLPLMEYDYDAGFGVPDQDEEGYPFGCRAYTGNSVAQDEDKQIYDVTYVCEKIAQLEGTPRIESGDIRTAAKVLSVYGVRPVYGFDDDALQHRRGPFYNVDKVPGYDWFDSMRAGMRSGKAPISVGTIFFPEWLNVASDGILTEHFVFDGVWDEESGHAYEICGEKTINNEPHLVAKMWRGKNYGNNGKVYFSREAFNKAFDIYGTIAIIQPPYNPKDVLKIKLTIIELVLYYIARMINIKRYA